MKLPAQTLQTCSVKISHTGTHEITASIEYNVAESRHPTENDYATLYVNGQVVASNCASKVSDKEWFCGVADGDRRVMEAGFILPFQDGDIVEVHFHDSEMKQLSYVHTFDITAQSIFEIDSIEDSQSQADDGAITFCDASLGSNANIALSTIDSGLLANGSISIAETFDRHKLRFFDGSQDIMSINTMTGEIEFHTEPSEAARKAWEIMATAYSEMFPPMSATLDVDKEAREELIAQLETNDARFERAMRIVE
jgi:hypothetical protein